MFNNKQDFIEFILSEKILKFGNFTLKSGRQSPYYFNTGLCHNGELITKLSSYYASYITQKALEFDFIFGPAYKGITLCSSISQSLFVNHQLNKPYAFNRKEKKDHGDMGQFVGCDISGSALIVDDVVSSGSSIIESIDLINEKKSKCHDVLVAFDRMEIGKSKMASLELQSEYNTVVHSIINLDDIADVVKSKSEYKSFINAMNDYMSTYRSV